MLATLAPRPATDAPSGAATGGPCDGACPRGSFCTLPLPLRRRLLHGPCAALMGAPALRCRGAPRLRPCACRDPVLAIMHYCISALPSAAATAHIYPAPSIYGGRRASRCSELFVPQAAPVHAAARFRILARDAAVCEVG
jgi:hypothetical protein